MDLDKDANGGDVRTALANGLKILRVLVESKDPLGASEIAKRCGMHQSSASRILKTLIDAGYVRKLSYRSFAVDYGILTLSAMAARHFKLIDKPRKALTDIARQHPSVAVVALTALWNGQLIYLLRTEKTQPEPAILALGGYPLHLSSPGLRLVLELPESDALRWLNESKLRHGWERPTPEVPAQPKSLLAEARRRVRHDCLVLDEWQKPGWLGAAIPIQAPGEAACALSVSVALKSMSIDEALLVLQDGRRAVEASLSE
jgi:DNA-binding IclR family transcriptional regulator